MTVATLSATASFSFCGSSLMVSMKDDRHRQMMFCTMIAHCLSSTP